MSARIRIKKIRRQIHPDKLTKNSLKRLSGLSKVHLIVFILIFAFIGGYILLTSHASSPIANVFVSSNGSDTGVNCKRFAPGVLNPDPSGTSLCATFNQAYILAKQGDTVEVENGIYQDQKINADTSKTSANGNCHLSYNGNGTFTEDDSGCVTFQPASGANVTIGCKTASTSFVDLNTTSPTYTGTTVPVISTAGCLQDNTDAYYTIQFGRNMYVHCTGLDATDFTGCSDWVYGSKGCGDATHQSGYVLCRYNAGATVSKGSLSLASYVRIRNMTIDNTTSTNGTTQGDIWDGVTATGLFVGNSSSDVWFEHGLTGDTNDYGADAYYNVCSHCGMYASINRNSNKYGSDDYNDYFNHQSNVYPSDVTYFYYVGNQNYGSGGSGNLFFGDDQTSQSNYVWLVNNWFGPLNNTQDGGTRNVSIVFKYSLSSYTNYTIEGNSSVGNWTITHSGSNDTTQNFIIEGNIGIQWPCSLSGVDFSGVTMKYNVDPTPACSSASNPTASNNLGGVATTNIWINKALPIPNLDLTGGPYTWENTWVSCPLSVDIHGTPRPSTCTPGAYQRPASGACPVGDLNGDCRVDVFDMSLFLSQFLSGNSSDDLNKDGVVNVVDLSILLGHYTP